MLLALKAAIVAMEAPGTAKAARTAGEWPFAVLYWIWMASLFRRNIRLPWWTGLAVGLYLTLPLPLLVAAIGAVRDRKAPRWQRIGVPLSLALGALFFYVTLLKGHIPEKLIPLADHDAVAAVVCFLPLALPAGFTMVWLAGFISRARRKK